MAIAVRRKTLINPGKHRRLMRKLGSQRDRNFGSKRLKHKAPLAPWGERVRSSARRGQATKAPAYRKNGTLTLAQRLAGFGGKSAQRRAESTVSRKRPAKARRNVSAIITAGLPAMNPHKKRGNNSMASNKTKSRRNASSKTTRRRTNFFSKSKTHTKRRHRTRTNPVATKVVYRYRTRKNSFKGRKHRKNPSVRGGASLLMKGLWGAGGALGSRMLPQIVLGSNNKGPIGYAVSVATGLGLGWAAGKFVNKEARSSVLTGAAIALVLRLVQDFTPFSEITQKAGLGDVGALMASQYLDPALFTGNGAERRVPPGLRPPALPPAAPAAPGVRAGVSGLGASTYGRNSSTYRS